MNENFLKETERKRLFHVRFVLVISIINLNCFTYLSIWTMRRRRRFGRRRRRGFRRKRGYRLHRGGFMLT